jgi:FKBP-type peptidyl-prolyl cis-trans isomerase FklB
MKRLTMMTSAIVAFASLNLNAQKMEFKTQADSVSYAVGVSVGNNLKSGGFEGLSSDLISAGLAAAMKGEKTVIDAQAANQIIQDYMTAAQAKKGAEANARCGAFLETNKKRKEVTTLPSGLQYEVIKTGTGAKPGATDKVKVHYHGTLIDGSVFDSSVERGQPAEFGVNQVIKGWTEALQLMNTGSKWKIFLPADLAYGDRGAGGKIGPNEALIFEVELLEIMKGE